MANTKLMQSVDVEKLISMGFTESNDGSGDPRGIDWSISNGNLSIQVDPWFDVTLCRTDCHVESLQLRVETVDELQSAIDFILH